MELFKEGNPIFGLSPLAGVSDLAFRKICFEKGADFAVTEMVSAKALYYGNRKTEDLLKIDPTETQVGCQLFGSEPEIFMSVIKNKINPRDDIDWIDLNLGCPAPKIVKNGEGSALMKDPKLVGRIVKSMVQASNKPVTVKLRLGFDDRSINYLEIGKIAEAEGASSLTLHARTREQMYAGHADWEAIGRLKESVSIPVIGNGDVRSPEDAEKLLDQTGCDGIAIGRGATGRPFIFEQIKTYRQTGHYEEPSMDQIIDLMKRHYRYELEDKGDRLGLLNMRKHIAWYIGGMPGSAKCKDAVNRAQTKEEVFEIIEDFSKNL